MQKAYTAQNSLCRFKTAAYNQKMGFAIVLILLVVGTVLFHLWSPWWFTPIASNWGTIDDTINLTFWITGVVFVAVNLFMAYAVI
ncbi:MAG: hypothetical protein V3T69_09960, partial [Acidiferrobacterales bacterium]